MEKHVQIALANAQSAIAFVDPWARITHVKDVQKYNAVLAELNVKYGFTGEDAIKHNDLDIECYAELRLDIPLDEEGCLLDDTEMWYPEFWLGKPKKYNDEYYAYGVQFEMDVRTIRACDYGRETPYTVEAIFSRKAKSQRQERMARLIELDAPKIILLNEEMFVRAEEYMIQVPAV